ncbi:MAG: FkbM family methyltransferase [Flavobacteriia bacterium]|nr:FkbM family methyltransferase [Flavobacteriia bacterium]
MKKKIKKLIGKKFLNFLKKLLYKRIDELDVIHNYLKRINSNHGVMVDVGVHYGESCIPFLKDGWKVYGFEPDKENQKILKKEITDTSNFVLFDYALSNEPGEMNFYASEESTGISSLLNFHETHIISNVVKVETLKNIIDQHNIQNIKLLKIDVEGYDYFVLKGFDFEKHTHPEYIICEYEDLKTSKLGYNVLDMIEYLQTIGYKVLVCEWEPIIKYGGHHRFNKAKFYPCDLNPKAWGNLIAFKDENFIQFALKKMN